MNIFDIIIGTVGQFLSLIIVADALLSFVLAPTHPLREAIGRVLLPIYNPIRRMLPSTGMLDFTPIVALILIQVVVMLLTSIF